VWRFVAGLTKFKEYGGRVIEKSMIFTGSDTPRFSLLLFQCFLEARNMECRFESSPTEIIGEVIDPSPLDAYALGYFIANFPIEVSWKVGVKGPCYHSFACGLQTHRPAGVIKHLQFQSCPLKIAELKCHPIYSITSFHLQDCNLTNLDLVHLSELIPQLPCLKRLNISNNCGVTDGEQDGLLKVLHGLYESQVNVLLIFNMNLGKLLESPHDYSSAIASLMHKELEILGVGEEAEDTSNTDSTLAEVLSAPSSLKHLCLPITFLSLHAEHLKSTSVCDVVLYHANYVLPVA
jgi:hypothetical protein